ncbi:MAG: pyridoxamine 5'-phosphate oxidase family protein [Chloroflexota bacterium]|nr:pyridoxamine 5'-phosphate oxidase family protein [Chloroflexota bacterium]
MADNAQKEPVGEALYGDADAKVTPWAETRARLSVGGTHWLATVRPDGRPHVVPVGVALLENLLYFTTGQGTRKQQNLAHNAHCVITTTTPGYDLVVEGTAAQVREDGLLQRVAAVYVAQGWPATVQDGAFAAPFSAPTTGPPPYDVYEITPTVAFAFGTAEATVYYTTRYRF